MAYVSTDVSLTYGSTAGASVFIKELWADAVAGYFKKPTTFITLADDSLSGLVKGQGDTIHIPKMTAKTAQATTPQAISGLTANITYEAPDDTETKIQINKLAYNAHIIADVVKIQATPELFTMYAEGMGYAIKQDVENYLGDLFSGASLGNMVEASLDTANELDADDLKDVVSTMYTNGANPRDGYVAVVSPELAGSMLTVTNFTSSDFSRTIGATAPSSDSSDVAQFGTLAGMPLYVSDRFTASATADTIVGSIFKPKNLKIAYQVKPTVVSQYSVDFLGTKVAAYVAYGASIVDEGQVFAVTNP
jgi:hypothetical protein